MPGSGGDGDAQHGREARKPCRRGPRHAGLRGGAGRVHRELRAPRRARSGLLRLPSRGEGRRPLGRHPGQGDRRAVGGGHHGPGPLHDQGHGRPGDGARPFAGAVRLRRAREHLLAGVRPAREGADHGPAAAVAPGRPVRPGRAAGQEPRRRSRPAGCRSRPAEAGLAARHAPGLSRRSPSGFTRASCCAGSIRGTGPSAGSSRRRSRLRWDSTSTSGCRRRSRTRGWRRSTGSAWWPRSSRCPRRSRSRP